VLVQVDARDRPLDAGCAWGRAGEGASVCGDCVIAQPRPGRAWGAAVLLC
jgi:hypothetical protein